MLACCAFSVLLVESCEARFFNNYSPERIQQAKRDLQRFQRLDQYGSVAFLI